MNITPIEIYWLTRLDEFLSLLGVVIFILIILVITNTIGGGIAMDDAQTNRRFGNSDEAQNDEERMRKRFMRAAKISVAAFLLGLLASLVPSTKQMAAIIIVPKLANSEIVAEMGDAAKEMIRMAKDWMRTVSPSQDSKEGSAK